MEPHFSVIGGWLVIKKLQSAFVSTFQWAIKIRTHIFTNWKNTWSIFWSKIWCNDFWGILMFNSGYTSFRILDFKICARLISWDRHIISSNKPKLDNLLSFDSLFLLHQIPTEILFYIHYTWPNENWLSSFGLTGEITSGSDWKILSLMFPKSLGNCGCFIDNHLITQSQKTSTFLTSLRTIPMDGRFPPSWCLISHSQNPFLGIFKLTFMHTV